MDFLALGESLIDFVTVPGEFKDKIYMEGSAGGAVANVMAMTAKLGHPSAFISKVGRDSFGAFIRAQIAAAGVEVGGMVSGDEPTTLAMVTLDAHGDRSFAFYRDRTADVMLQEHEVDMALVRSCRVFHFGTVSMVSDPARATTLKAAAEAKAAGAKISFDPNYRPFLWPQAEPALAAMRAGVELADYVKLSEEEARMLTGEADPEKAAMMLQSRYHFAFLAVTLGPRGCVGLSPAARVTLPTFDVPTVDTTGAGDAFWGAALHKLAGLGEAVAGEKELADILNFGNAAGSLATTRLGAIAAQPTEAEILRCMKNEKPLIL